MAAPLTLEDFAPHVDSAFTLDPGGLDVALTLTVAAELGTTAHGDPPRVPFRLEFHGPADPAVAQAIVPLDHPVMGRLDLFLVPLARDAAGTRYEAIFN
jgi:hypothetical protein